MINHHVVFCCVCACMFSLPQHFQASNIKNSELSKKTQVRHQKIMSQTIYVPWIRILTKCPRPFPEAKDPAAADALARWLRRNKLPFSCDGKKSTETTREGSQNLWIIRVSIWKGCVNYKIVGGVYLTYAMVMDWYLMWVWTFSFLNSRFQDITCYFRTSRHLGWDSTFMSIYLPIKRHTFEVEKPSWVVVSNCEPHFPYHQ